MVPISGLRASVPSWFVAPVSAFAGVNGGDDDGDDADGDDAWSATAYLGHWHFRSFHPCTPVHLLRNILSFIYILTYN